MRRVTPKRASSRSLLAASLMFKGLSSRERINDSAPGLTQTVAITTVPAAKCWSPENQSTKPKKPLGFVRLSREMSFLRLSTGVEDAYRLDANLCVSYTFKLTEEQLELLTNELGAVETSEVMAYLAQQAVEQGLPPVYSVHTDSAGWVVARLEDLQFSDLHWEKEVVL